MTDIQNRSDIKVIVDAFYQRAIDDDVIGFIFSEKVVLILDEHLPVIYDFWDSVLFHTATYRGNPMMKHINLSKQVGGLTDTHFDRWIQLWTQTINEHYQGGIATAAIEKATSMRLLMQHKIKMSGDRGYIQ